MHQLCILRDFGGLDIRVFGPMVSAFLVLPRHDALLVARMRLCCCYLCGSSEPSVAMTRWLAMLCQQDDDGSRRRKDWSFCNLWFRVAQQLQSELVSQGVSQFQSMLLWPAASLLSIEVVDRNTSITGRTWSLGR